MKNKNFHRLVFKLLVSNGKNMVSLTSYHVAMATNFDVIATAICSLVKPSQSCTKSLTSRLLV